MSHTIYESDVLAPVPLGNHIFLFEPRAQPQPAADCGGAPPPSLIILCTWLGGATTARITNYTSGYRKAYPGATLLLIRTVLLDITARSFNVLRTRLRPARDVIIKALQQPKDDQTTNGSGGGDVLLHIFSHGGCNTAIQLALSMHEAAGTLLCDHLRQVVFDCCPGDASFEKAYNAAVLSLPPSSSRLPLVRALSLAAVYSSVAAITGLQNAGLMRSVRDMRRALNDPAVFGTRARRLYLFSRADRMVGPADVQSHARLARESGYEVGLTLFRESPHCALVTEDAARYWRAIQDCWTGLWLPQLPLGAEADYGPKL